MFKEVPVIFEDLVQLAGDKDYWRAIPGPYSTWVIALTWRFSAVGSTVHQLLTTDEGPNHSECTGGPFQGRCCKGEHRWTHIPGA